MVDVISMEFAVNYALFFIVHLVRVESFAKCYNVTDYEHCLSMDNMATASWYDAKMYCQANNSRLLSIIDNVTQSVYWNFRTSAGIGEFGTWINVLTTTVGSFHWISGLRGSSTVDNQQNDPLATRRFAVITTNMNQLAYYAQTFNTRAYYICQYSDEVCVPPDFSKNSKCYRKYNSEQVTWFTASNKCLSMNGSLATFNDLSTPNSDNNLTVWLNITSNSQQYWVGLVRGWFVTTARDGSSIDVQYTNWDSSAPSASYSVDSSNTKCVLIASNGIKWLDIGCMDKQRFVCDAIRALSTTTLTSTFTTVSSITTVSKTSFTDASTTALSSAYNSTTTSKNKSNTSIIIGVVVGVGVPVIITIVVVVVLVVYRRQRNRSPSGSTKEPKDIDRLTSTNGSINKPETPSPQLGRQQPEGNEAQYAVVERTKESENGLVTTTDNNEQRHTQTYATIVRDPQATTFENNAYENPSEELAGGPNESHVIYADLAPSSPLCTET